MNKKLLLYIVLSLIGILGLMLCVVQFVMAIRFGELGRVLLYFVLAILTIELAALSVVRIMNIRKNKDNT